MSWFARQRFKPGVKGYSPRPLTPDEAMVIQNLEMLRDGTWKPRPGLETKATLAGTIRHVSGAPGGFTDGAMAIGGGNLYRVNVSTWTATNLASGWPTAGRVRHTFGSDATGGLYWLAHKSATDGLGAGLFRVTSAGAYAQVAAAPNGKWVENHGLYNLVVDGGATLRYSDDSDSDTWPGANSFYPFREAGLIYAVVSLTDAQCLIFGSNALGVLAGNEASTWSQGLLLNTPFRSFPGMPLCKVGNRVAVMGPNSRIFIYSPSLDRVDVPAHDDMAALGDMTELTMWYDPVMACVAVSELTTAQTYFFDVERGTWIGTWDKALVGLAVYEDDLHPRNFRVLGYGSKLVKPDLATYTDDGAAFTCALETVLPSVNAPESEKQCANLHIDGDGDWTVKLYGRNSPNASWTLLDTRTVAAPGWAYFTAHTYREGKVRFEATAASGVRFRSFACDERAVGVAA